MIIKTLVLKAVAVQPKQYPENNLPEVAFVGRSNVGKSSLINMLLNRKRFARTSSSPGKTQTINFYEINNSFRIVDLPGYGYAKISKAEKEKWGRMIEDYLKSRENLVKVFQLVDLRHPPSELDIQMYEWLRFYGLDGVVVATKSDKISSNDKQKNISIIRKVLELKKDDILIAASSVSRQGHDEILDLIETLITEK
ncbi:MAG: YihA family ribosome biogenesis GTP-binding protein [Clostridiales bacterium]|nr:YihA family ribosome biogenesis GTP-binding protein [Clostridiales bacterium]